jgi:hypothetical protein
MTAVSRWRCGSRPGSAPGGRHCPGPARHGGPGAARSPGAGRAARGIQRPGRVAALERYAAEVREADAADRDWQQAAALAELSGQHLDMPARTAADEHGVAEIQAMSQHARAVGLALRELPG